MQHGKNPRVQAVWWLKPVISSNGNFPTVTGSLSRCQSTAMVAVQDLSLKLDLPVPCHGLNFSYKV